jgi:hypothetical protein
MIGLLHHLIASPAILVPIVAVQIGGYRYMRRRRRNRKDARSAFYREYINSAQWRKVRRKALKRAGGRCEHRGVLGRCHSRTRLQVHHRSYRHFANEWDGRTTHGEDLQVLCVKHHGRIHDGGGLRRAPSYVH